MSKNFELLQRAGKEREVVVLPERQASLTPVNGNGKGQRNETGLNLDRLTREECLRLVQRIFLQQVGKRPRAVVFAGVDQGKCRSRALVMGRESVGRRSPGAVWRV